MTKEEMVREELEQEIITRRTRGMRGAGARSVAVGRMSNEKREQMQTMKRQATQSGRSFGGWATTETKPSWWKRLIRGSFK